MEDFAPIAVAISKDLLDAYHEFYSPEVPIKIETIQDDVENELMMMADDLDGVKIAKAYILYRDKHRIQREKNERYKDVVKQRAVAGEASNQRQNANLDEKSFSGRMYEASEAIWKMIAVEDFIPEDVRYWIDQGMLYPHDLARFALGQNNCLTVNLEQIFKEGFRTRHVHLRPPARFSSACQQLAVIFQVLSQHQFGGIASGHIDRELAPFVKKTEEKVRAVAQKYGLGEDYIQEQVANDLKQGAEALVHNLATLQSRPGAQLPFSSINLGADTSKEGRMVAHAILTAVKDGVGVTHNTPPFPIVCFQIKKGINFYPDDPNHDLKMLAIECSTRRLTPNYVNLDSSVCHSTDDPDTWLTAMGCRTQMGKDRFNPENPYNRIGRGNLAPHTIIPVPLGIKYGVCNGEREKPNLDGFCYEFERLLEAAERSLLTRVQIIFSQKMGGAYELYANHAWKADYEYDPQASVYEVLKHGTLVIGQLGWAETLTALFGKHHMESEEAKEFLLKMTTRVNEFCQEASERNNLNFAAYYTPAESLCHTGLKKLQALYGIIPGVTDKAFLTNSIHVPVDFKCDILDKIAMEANFAKLATGGNIVYAEFDSTAVQNLEGVEQVIDFAMEHDIPYFAFNFPLDECTVCGYSGEIPAEGCPECGAPDNKIDRIRRVTGYITGNYREYFNQGKVAEVQARVTHTDGKEVEISEGSENIEQ